jgi:hypothetical protein
VLGPTVLVTLAWVPLIGEGDDDASCEFMPGLLKLTVGERLPDGSEPLGVIEPGWGTELRLSTDACAGFGW